MWGVRADPSGSRRSSGVSEVVERESSGGEVWRIEWLRVCFASAQRETGLNRIDWLPQLRGAG